MVDSQLDPDAAKNIFAATFVFVFKSFAVTPCQAAELMRPYFLVHAQNLTLLLCP